MIIVKGVLRFADATQRDSGHIRVVDVNNNTHKVKVPEGMMNDIVKPLWDTTVLIKGWMDGSYLLLEDIEEQ